MQPEPAAFEETADRPPPLFEALRIVVEHREIVDIAGSCGLEPSMIRSQRSSVATQAIRRRISRFRIA
jgi:hypothetical protein